MVFGDKDGKSNQLLAFESSALSVAKQSGYFSARSSSFGLYVDGHAKSIVFLWPSGGADVSISPNNLTVYVTGKQEMLAKQAKLAQNSLQNVKKDSANQFSFETSYSEKRIVVTQLGYDLGWSAKATLEDGTKIDCPMYKLDGGLVGFLAPAGNVHYVLSYCTPYLKGGVALACVASSAFFGFGLYSFLRNAKKKEAEKAPSEE